MFIGFLFLTPSLYEKYRSHDIQEETFTKPIWFHYYNLGKDMYNGGIRKFNDTTTYSYLTSQPKEGSKKSRFEVYDEFGGFKPIQDLIDECRNQKDNDEYHFSEIQKYECLRKMQSESLIDVTNEKLVNSLCKSTLKQLQAFMQRKTSEIFASVNCGEVVEYNLLDDLDIAIDKMNEGEAMGLPLHDSPRLNKKIKGWRKGDIIYLVLSSGMGKSSIALEKFVLSLIENGEKGMMFANEENIWKTRNLALATTASKILGKAVNREKLLEGSFDENTMKKLLDSKDWLEKNPKDLIKFYDMKKYRVDDMLSRIQLMKPLNYSYVSLDTFKPETNSGESARWEAFGNAAQDIHSCIKAEANNVALLATVQLKIGKEYRYLDLSAVGKSLEIVEVASVVLMGRLLYKDEMPEQREALFTYNWEKNAFTDKWEKKEYILDPSKTYMIIFIAKNRLGDVSEQIIYEVNYGINSFKEVGYAQMGKKSNSMF